MTFCSKKSCQNASFAAKLFAAFRILLLAALELLSYLTLWTSMFQNLNFHADTHTTLTLVFLWWKICGR